ncbi:phage tail family protein [Listeria monocytogenes]|uniref:phage tail family protein n=1 Tax=Listeria monocytogenes TaxID=1639 RepID=UPI001C60FFD7|nr:phage tail family protein [Listeria monocytogenes]MBW5774513.1 phage tail family protein [Listeria monocytogenes]
MATSLALVIEGKTYMLNELFDLEVGEVSREPPQIVNNYTEFAGSDGARTTDSNFSMFPISILCHFQTKTADLYHIKLDELMELIYQRSEYFLAHSKTPGKKYRVHPNGIKIDRKAPGYADLTLEFDVFRGYSESIGSTLSDTILDCEKWQFGQGLAMEDYRYTHTKSRFIIYNGGSFDIDPREHFLSITVRGQNEGELTINNITTGDRFIYYPALSATDTLVIDSATPRINGNPCGRSTNHGLISLQKGENLIEISNTSHLDTKWDFSFLYK